MRIFALRTQRLDRVALGWPSPDPDVFDAAQIEARLHVYGSCPVFVKASKFIATCFGNSIGGGR
jgi:hypothetical protein